jgi:hypothetical protein
MLSRMQLSSSVASDSLSTSIAFSFEQLERATVAAQSSANTETIRAVSQHAQHHHLESRDSERGRWLVWQQRYELGFSPGRPARIHRATDSERNIDFLVHRLAIGRLLRLDMLDAIQECGAE